jgi:hypothetical protein
MIGKQPGTIAHLQLVDIHGARFYDLSYALDAAPNRVLTSRIGTESVYENPQIGDKVKLHLVMGQLTKVEKADGS